MLTLSIVTILVIILNTTGAYSDDKTANIKLSEVILRYLLLFIIRIKNKLETNNEDPLQNLSPEALFLLKIGSLCMVGINCKNIAELQAIVLLYDLNLIKIHHANYQTTAKGMRWLRQNECGNTTSAEEVV